MVVLERGPSEVPLALDACSVSELLENRRGVSVALRIDTEVHVGQRSDKAIAVAVQVVVIERLVACVQQLDSEVRVGGDVEVVVVAAGVVGDTRVCRGRDEEEL